MVVMVRGIMTAVTEEGTVPLGMSKELSDIAEGFQEL
jgi:hypothetical protein